MTRGQQPDVRASGSRVSWPVHPVGPHVQPGHGLRQLAGLTWARDDGQKCKRWPDLLPSQEGTAEPFKSWWYTRLKSHWMMMSGRAPAVSFQLDRFIPISRLKYYFAVDTVYVGKKLGLLVFPYMHEVCLRQTQPAGMPRWEMTRAFAVG